jgi:4-carboxymuconolactone decarboxylase
MSISEAAEKYHEQLFPNHRSTLKVSDPELVALFDDFAFDEVIRDSRLDARTRMIVVLGSMIGSGAVNEFKVLAGAALNVGVTPIEIKEIVYQSVAYVGMGRAFDFVHAINDVLTSRGVPLPLEGQSTTEPATRREKGLAAQKAIFGAMIDQMYERSPKDLLHIQRFLSANCFGDYYTRGGLDPKTRELVTLSILIALGGADSQVKGHVQGNVSVGNGRDVLIDVITQLLPWVGYPRTLNALAALNEVAPEQE